MQDRPTTDELLEAVAEYLERDVVPLGGKVGFHGRVARNVVEIVRRELVQGAAADARELEGLRALLGPDAPDDLRLANHDLSGRIRAGAFDGERRDELLMHLRATARDKLAIANPRELEPPSPEDP